MSNISSSIRIIVVLAFAALVACSGSDEHVYAPGSSRDAGTAGQPGAEFSILELGEANGYTVRFDGRQYDGEFTTFSYTVTGTGADHALSHFALELPSCAPDLYTSSPDGGIVGVNPLTGLYGVKWELSLAVDGSRGYSVTFAGDVPLGVITATVKAGTEIGLVEIAGPCGGFEISGVVYVDADSNGALDGADESGLQNVTVTLVDANGGIQTELTDSGGFYSFRRIAGTYTVEVEAATPAIDYNEELFGSFDVTGPTSLVVEVGPDAFNNNFGFEPRSDEIILDLETGVLLTDGESVKFWKGELRSAMNNGKGNSVYDAATLLGFVSQLQALFLDDPFAFTPGNELQEALDILNDNTKDSVIQLKKELLAAELNEVSGKGLIGADGLQLAILSWAESLVAQYSVSATISKGMDQPQLTRGSGDTQKLDDATLLLELLNGSAATGGGAGGEG